MGGFRWCRKWIIKFKKRSVSRFCVNDSGASHPIPQTRHHVFQPEEKIYYNDVCSEYPYVNKNKEYLIGHRVVHSENFKNPRQCFGIMKCTILLPRNLVLPVLPYKNNRKLTFRCAGLVSRNRITPRATISMLRKPYLVPSVPLKFVSRLILDTSLCRSLKCGIFLTPRQDCLRSTPTSF